MKHIFMGKINCICYEYVFFYRIEDYLLDDYLAMLRYRDDKEFPGGHVFANIDKTEYVVIKETTNIEERVLEHSKVNINNEELYVEKVIQCDNGDIICYTNKILKEIVDEESI